MLKKLFKSLRSPSRNTPAQEPLPQQRAEPLEDARPARTSRPPAKALSGPQPEYLEHDQHAMQRSHVNKNAVNVVERLQKAGYEAYLVGGCVRDLLLDMEPKDFDVATNATPEQIRMEFRNSRVIGRRFKLVHVHFGRDFIEVATFRANHPEGEEEEDSNLSSRNESGRILRDNVYGTLADDAQRRDLTINALYYDPTNESILDYARGVYDIKHRLIRLIGDPTQRYQEDPVRMLRAIRFAAKLDFDLELQTAKPIRQLAPLLKEIPAARLFEEVLKLFLSGYAEETFYLLVEYRLFEQLFPASAEALLHNPEYTKTLIIEALANTDLRVRQEKPVTPAFLFAAILWPALPARVLRAQEKGMPAIPAMQEAASSLITEQCQRIAIPKRFTLPIKEIWDMQERLPRRSGKRADLLLENSRFRAGYDFLLLRELAGEETDGLGEWWTDYQQCNDSERRLMIRDLGNKDDSAGAPRKRRRSPASKRKSNPNRDAE